VRRGGDWPSTRTLETFIPLLQTHELNQVVDVGTVPRSRHNPEFNREALPDDLNPAGIGRRMPFLSA